jgi:hypothetical protein
MFLFTLQNTIKTYKTVILPGGIWGCHGSEDVNVGLLSCNVM